VIRGWAYVTGGWTGGVTCGSDTTALPPVGSSISQALLVEAGCLVTLTMRDSGHFRIARGSSFALSGTGNALSRLGFTAGTAINHTAATLPYASTLHDAILYDPGSAHSNRRGVVLQSHAIRRARGEGEWRTPQLSALMEFAEWHAALETWGAHLSTPAQIDVIIQADNGSLSFKRLNAQGISLRPRDGATWLGDLSIDTTEAPT